MKRRARFEDFIQKIELLQDLDPYERSKLCDVLQSEVYADGEYVIKQVHIGQLTLREKTGTGSTLSRVGTQWLLKRIVRGSPNRFMSTKKMNILVSFHF